MLTTLDIILLAACGFFLGYLALLSIVASWAPRRRDFSAHHLRKFAVVVPAHNEELTIEKTVRSILDGEYEQQLFDVVVIADNCTDRTALLARAQGAVVLERHSADLKGKGYALRWCFDRLLSPLHSYDAIVVVDADSVVSPNFLTVMNWYLDGGSKAIQALDLVQPQQGSWSPEVTRLGMSLYNHVRPLGRKVLGCSAGLRGNGMCFSTELLRHVPWSAYSLTEDLEYGLELLLHGIPVHFAPEAVVYAAMPGESRHAVTQRARWETGRNPVVRAYAVRLLKAAFQQRSFRCIDAFIDLCTPPLVNMIVGVAAVAALHGVGALAEVEGAGVLGVWWTAVLCVGVLHVIVGLPAVGADRSLYKALAYVPLYALWKAGVYVQLIFKGKPEDWIRTTRENVHNASTH